LSVAYKSVGWNRQKRIYDTVLIGSVAAYLALFVGLGLALFPDATAETLLIRAFGTSALLLLHVVLCIGPLARLDPRFLPLLYNRRHMGVTMFALALAHGGFALVQFHAFGDVNPIVSLLASNPRWDSVAQFPFQPLGAAALLILFLMAATSHDFWLTNLSAPVWKALHMLVYLAYALIVLHVALGALQSETSPVFSGALGFGVALVLALHLVSARREALIDCADGASAANSDGFVDVCAVDDIAEGRGKVVVLGGERVAVFRWDRQVAALSNACRHQNGPLGEGRVLNGKVTCPWHGYEYLPHCGRSPAPFTEKVPTFRVRVVAGRVWVHPLPLPAGTESRPASIDGGPL
jgi:nitrite reductase/ring-hydroxylating ferredoxin subunit/DMSO/TMAO reductase YedYZ heme-binding membrane subunit